VAVGELAADTGLDTQTVGLALSALSRTGYLVTSPPKYSGSIRVVSVTPKAYEATGLHPNPAAVTESLIALLNEAAERSDDPDERSKLVAVAKAAGNVGGQVLTNVLAALLARLAGA